jgi:hypothetical protein
MMAISPHGFQATIGLSDRLDELPGFKVIGGSSFSRPHAAKSPAQSLYW